MTLEQTRWQRGRRGEAPMVPDATPQSYYGQPVIRRPHWKRLDIAGYLFMGGLAAGSSLLAAGADVVGLPRLARRSKVAAAAAITVSAAALVHDLGRPARFANMLRTFKPTSPMSMGSWLLAAYGPAAGAAAVATPTRLRWARVPATAVAALLAPAVASYTGVLIADTAVPAWHEAGDAMPFTFVGSAASAAGGLALAVAPFAETRPARHLAVIGAALEVVGMEVGRRRAGLAGEAYSDGKARSLVALASGLTAGGAIVATLGRRSRIATTLGGLAMVGGSLATRLGVFEAGLASADDPRYTVEPQRRRLAARA